MEESGERCRTASATESIDDGVGVAFEIGWGGIRRGWEIGVNADANRHARSEVVDVNIGDEQGGAAAEKIMTAGLAHKPEGNGPVPLSDFECRGLAVASELDWAPADSLACTMMRRTPSMGGSRLASIVPEAPTWKDGVEWLDGAGF